MGSLKDLQRRIAERFFFLGPVFILAVEVSGESGIVEVFGAGRETGYALLWVFVVALVYKYAFAYGIARYTLSTGKTIFSGLRSIPGPRNWEVSFITLIYVLEMIAYGGFLLIAAHFLSFILPVELPVLLLAFLTLAGIITILWKGSYERFENVILGIVLLLFAGIIFSLFTLEIPVPEVAAGLIPQIYDHHLMWKMALLGVVGAGLNLLLYSVWLHEKIGGKPCDDLPGTLRIIRSDLAIGFGFIALMSFIFLAIGASYYGMEDLAGVSSALAVSLHLLATLPLVAHVFIFSSFVLLAGAVISGIDGRARAVCGILREAGGVLVPPKQLYQMILLVFSGIIIGAFFISKPEYLIKHISIFASIMFAVIGFALIYIDNHLPKKHQGSRIWLAVMAVGSGIYLLIALLQEKSLLLFGIPLMERLAIVFIIIYLFVRSDLASAFRRGVATRTDLLWLILIFGVLSIYGTFRGFPIADAIVNFRDLGPVLAGLIGGPLAGAAAGAIGGIYRYSLGGWTALACAVATVAAGIIGGIAGRRMKLTIFRAALLGVGVEAVHILVIFPLLTLDYPRSEVLEVIRHTFPAMALALAAGLIMYTMLEEQYKKTLDMKDLVCWIRQEIDPDLKPDSEDGDQR